MSSGVQKSGNNPLVTPQKATQPADTPAIPTDNHFGCDYISLSITINPNHLDLSDAFWVADPKTDKDTKAVYDNFKGQVRVGHTTVYLYLMPLRELLTIKFNPSRVLTGRETATLCHPDDVNPIVKFVIEKMESLVGGIIHRIDYKTGELMLLPDWATHLKISRLDVTRDFHIQDEYARRVESSWAALRAKGRQTKSQHSSQNGKGFSVYHRTSSQGSDKIYNKSAELKRSKWKESTIGEGVYRFESQLQDGRLRKYGFRTLADVNTANVWDAICDRWATTGFGCHICDEGDLMVKLTGLSKSKVYSMVGFMELAAMGRMDLSDRGDQRRYKEASGLGLIPGLHTIQTGEEIGFIDLHRGEVTTS